MRIVVVGTGVMGLSAADELAGRGHEVVALDRYGVGNELSSSSGDSRIWRYAHPDRERVRLMQYAIDSWRRLEQDSAQQLLVTRGLLWRGGQAHEVAAALAAEGVDAELADAPQRRQLFPELAWDDSRPVVWQPDAGVILADGALAALAERATRAGARLVPGVSVSAVQPRDGGGVRVITDHETYDADRAIVTTGPWAEPFLHALGVDIALDPVLAQVSYFLAAPQTWQQRPCLVDVPDDASSFGYYAMPVLGGGYKIAKDEEIRPFDPTSDDRSTSPSHEAEVVAWATQNLPTLGSAIQRSAVCAWTSSPDDLFVLDRWGDVIVGCGDSGQGFKFLPLFGRLLADLAEGQPTLADAAIFGASRFR